MERCGIRNEPRRELCIVAAHDAWCRYVRPAGLESLVPPVPIEKLARSLGFQVIDLNGVSDELSAIVSVQTRLIGLNARHSLHRRRFSLGHELAHVLLQHPPECRCTRREVRLHDREADLCASELLMPAFLLRGALDRGANATRLSALFCVSMEAMLHRLERLSPAILRAVD